MTKTIFALGGGTFGEPRRTYKSWSLPMPKGQENYEINTTPVDKLILKATNKSKPKLLLIMTASEDGQHDLPLLEQAFRTHFEGRLGAKFDTLKLVTQKPSLAEIKEKIASAEAIYASGGNTYLMMRVWRRLGVDKMLRDAYKKGTVMSGMSAGSICWFSYGNSNSFYNNKPFRVTAMGWHKLLICPHYDTEPYRQPALKKMTKRAQSIPAIALDEHAALEVVDNSYRIHIFKTGAKARKCYWQNGSYKIEELESRQQYSPFKELLDI